MTQTTQAQLTPTTDQTPAIANATYELSGSQWVARFPGSVSTNDLTPAFKTAVDNFIAALKNAGAAIHIAATFRPPERAYMMHWSWEIAIGGAAASSAPHMNGVNIEWVHPTNQVSVQAARAMAQGFGIQDLHVPPSLHSRHTEKNAIDMNVTWSGNLNVQDGNGNQVVITTSPRTGMNAKLHEVGASYGVIKFVGGAADKPHWSTDGH